MAHFGIGSAVLAGEDKPLPDVFAQAIRSSDSDVLVTVEGFADPLGVQAATSASVNAARRPCVSI